MLPPVADISADILYDPQGATLLSIYDENDNVVREWSWFPEDYPLEIREIWDGTDNNGIPVPAGRYRVELQFGGAAHSGPPYHVNAGPRSWKALCLTETQGGWDWDSFSFSHYRENWMEYFTTSGGAMIGSAWGPWKELNSLSRIVDEVRGRIKDVFGLADIRGWAVRYWQSDAKFRDNIPDPVASFVAGNNPFNDYDLGIFIGHGVACAGGDKPVGAGILTRPPEHYYPLTVDRKTGETHWVGSAQIPKYGEGGKLKWMFLMTCNPLVDDGAHDIFTPCRANDTLPFGDSLHMLCGYSSKILLESRIGEFLSDALAHEVPEEDYRDGTVLQAWGYVWEMTSNKAENKIARAVYWPECEHNTIYGVEHENITPPQAHASQAELEFTDFANP